MQHTINKLFIQLTISATLFFGSWFALSQIDFKGFFEVKDNSNSLEKKLGNFYINLLKEEYNSIEVKSITDPIQNILTKICKANNINPDKIKLYVLKSRDVNAFALPDNNIVIMSSLITDCHSAEELAGVIAHELAHIENKHVMKKLTKELGLTALYTLLTGGGGGSEAVRVITSLAYDRKFEKQADNGAVNYLINTEIDPEGLASFLYRLSTEENKQMKYLEWISTHPDSEKRAETIIKLKTANHNFTPRPLMKDDEWKELKESEFLK